MRISLKRSGTPGHLTFQSLNVEEVAALARKIVNEAPIIVAIDYCLDEQPAGLAYKGSCISPAFARRLYRASRS